MISHIVEEKGNRFDIYMMSILPEYTRSKIQSLIKLEKILINGHPSKPSYILKGNESITYKIESIDDVDKAIDYLHEKMSLDIIFEDENILVVNKPSGLVVHPGAGNKQGTLLNGVIDKIDKTGFTTIPGIVHRLDKETSGVIIIAKNPKAHGFLSKQFEKREVNKKYISLVWGKIQNDGFVEGNIVRHHKNRKAFKMTNGPGRYSFTSYKVLNQFGPFSFLELKPKTGRTHQIRVHMKSIGHPILCDTTYSGGKNMIKSFHVKYSTLIRRIYQLMNRVSLHAKSIEILSPTSTKKKTFIAPMPIDIENSLAVLKENEYI